MKAILLPCALLLFSTAAAAIEPAATVNAITGSVLVNQGKQFVPVQSGQALVAGDRVMVMQDSGAALRFTDGCDVRLEGGTIVTVPTMSTCAGGALEVSRLTGNTAMASTGVGGGWILAGVGALAIGTVLSEGTISP